MSTHHDVAAAAAMVSMVVEHRVLSLSREVSISTDAS